MLRTACNHMREWCDAGLRPVRIAVNVSTLQLSHEPFIQTVRDALRDAKLSPGQIELEITETAIMQDDETSAATLQACAEMGIGLSLDDFGTGYSSLS